jgi:16S rRNA (guanine966-N2)-methyltransferase
MRQALFDMLMHAPWAGRAAMEQSAVLDVFAGTGALGLEALSRGAARATFIERDARALGCLRANIAACRASGMCVVLAVDALAPPRGQAAGLVFLDPPYGQNLVERAVAALTEAGRIGPEALLVAEVGRDEPLPVLEGRLLAERAHGAARIAVWRHGGG